MKCVIGFVGLGRLGAPIARRLAAAGHTLVVLQRHAELARTEGWLLRTTPAEIAQDADVVLTCLPTPQVSRDVYLGEQGLLTGLSGLSRGLLFIELSTIDPGLARSLADASAAIGAAFLDAPVSGGPKGAADGSLTVMAGGSLEDFERATPLLACFSARRLLMGSAGAGSATKMCNQMLTGVTHLLVAEAMVLGAKAGLDPARLYEVLSASSGKSNSLDRAVPNFILPRKFDPAFALDGIYKDLECVTRTGKQLGARLLLAAVAQQVYEEARSLGLGGQDVASVVLAVERASGTQVQTAASAMETQT